MKLPIITSINTLRCEPWLQQPWYRICNKFLDTIFRCTSMKFNLNVLELKQKVKL